MKPSNQIDALNYNSGGSDDDKATAVEDVAGSTVDANGAGGGVGAGIRGRHRANPKLGAESWDGKEGKNGQLSLNLFFVRSLLPTEGWPSGLRRWFKAPVSSEARVRISPLSDMFCSLYFALSVIYFNILMPTGT